MERTTVERVASSAVGTYFAHVLHGLAHPDLRRPSGDARDAERELPGDDIVDDPDWRTTFATTIDAPREEVWPWLVQMGYGRAGWYTWYRFDNGGGPSADRIVPELQGLEIGDILPDGPRASEGFGVWVVCILDAPKAMVLASRRNPFDGREVEPNATVPSIHCTWAFALEPVAPEATRLLVRVCARLYNIDRATLVAKASRLVFGVGDAVMEQTLLEGLKERVERHRRSLTARRSSQ